MRTVKAFRLGHDDYVTFILPSKRKAAAEMEASWGKVYSLIERRDIEGGIPQPWQRVEQQRQP